MADTAAKREIHGVGTEESPQKVKRAKADNENGGGGVGNDPESENILSEFKTSSVLSDSAREKNIFIHGKVTVMLLLAVRSILANSHLLWLKCGEQRVT